MDLCTTTINSISPNVTQPITLGLSPCDRHQSYNGDYQGCDFDSQFPALCEPQHTRYWVGIIPCLYYLAQSNYRISSGIEFKMKLIAFYFSTLMAG